MTVVDLRMLCHGDVIITLLTRRALFPKRKLKGKSNATLKRDAQLALIPVGNGTGWAGTQLPGEGRLLPELKPESTAPSSEGNGEAKFSLKHRKKTLKIGVLCP